MADLKPIPAREFERFLIAKGTSIDCATCGHSPITIHDEQLAGKHAALVAHNFPTFQPTPAVHYSVLMAGCGNCGTLRFTARETVAAWLSNNPKP